MPYPPTVPPTGRTNATPQADNHPSDHNAISTALTDIINELGADPSLAYATVMARLAAMDATTAAVNASAAAAQAAANAAQGTADAAYARAQQAENDARARQPQIFEGGSPNAFGLPASTWSAFNVGPNFTIPYSCQMLVAVAAGVSCADGEVFLNFGIDGGGPLNPVSGHGIIHDGGSLWLSCAYGVQLGAGAHTVQVLGNTSGSGGSLRYPSTYAITLYTT
jgi:hypothetical protein